jgi:hypothetical protein
MDERLSLSCCTRCEFPLDGAAHSGRGSHVPTEGDLSVCLNCGNVMVYRADKTLRSMAEAEWLKLEPDVRHELERAQAMVDRFQANRKGGFQS